MKKILLGFIISVLFLGSSVSCHKKKPQPEVPVGDLKILSVAPKGENLPISLEGISVMFNQPMVPLTTLDEGRSESIPLSITPEVDGKFYWLGTQGFIFRPTKPFDPATHYKVKMPAATESIAGKKLGTDMEWDFSTVYPRVTNGTDVERILMPKKASLTVEFNLAMNTGEVEDKISFMVNEKAADLAAKYNWQNNGHTLLIELAGTLPWESAVSVIIPKGLHAKTGELVSQKEAVFNFTTPPEKLELAKMTFNSWYEDPNEDLIKGVNALVEAGDGICFCFNQPIVKNSFEKSFKVAWNDKRTTPEINPFFKYGNQDYVEIPPDLDEGAKPYDSVCAYFTDEFNRSYAYSLDPKNLRAYSEAKVNMENRKRVIQTGHASAELRSTLTKNILSVDGLIALPYRYTNLKSLTLRAYKLKNKDNYSETVRNESIELKGHYDAKTQETIYDVPYVSNPISLTGLSVPVAEEALNIDQSRMPADAEMILPLEGREDQSLHVMADLAPLHLESGLYLIEAFGKTLPLPDEPDSTGSTLSMILVTPYGVALKQETDHAMVWVTNIESGKPQSGVPVTLTLNAGTTVVHQAKLVTNAEGVAIATGNWEAYNATDGSLNLCAEIAKPYSYSCMYTHQLGYNSTLKHGKNYFTYIQTDRPIYRPGQTVYFSSFTREVLEGRHFMPGKTVVANVSATDASGNVVYDKQAQALEEGGVIRGSFDLDDSEDAPRGNYSLSIMLDNDQTFTKEFSVSSYKKPSFKVDVNAAKKEIINKNSLETQITGAYFFGAPMAKAKANVTFLTNNHIFAPDGFESFTFYDTDDLGSQGFNDYSYMEDYDYEGDYRGDEESSGGMESSDNYDSPQNESADRAPSGVFDKDAKKILPTNLDEQGKMKISYAPNLAKYPLSQELTIEAAVQDPSREEVSGFADIIVHKANHYVGLNPRQWVYGEHDKAQIDVVTVLTDGKPAASKSFKADFIRRDYKFMERRDAQGFWDFFYEPKDELIASKEIRTDGQGQATIDFDIPQSGTYRIVASGTDGKNPLQKSAVEISAWGKGYAPWKLSDAQTLELVPDKESYKLGETAHILVKSLVPTTRALMTIERGRLLDYHIIELGGSNASHIDIPITEGLIPNIYVNVVAHVGREDNRSPMLFKGNCELIVAPEQKRVQISIDLGKKGMGDNPPIYRPGDTVKATFKTTDPAGNPLKTHLIVGVADESVLRLLGYQLPDLAQKFFYDRINGVKTSSSLLSLKAGDGGPADGRKRRNFKDTAHFEGHLTTDENGEASLTFKLPDDLTTWVMDAFAISESKTPQAFEAERLAVNKNKTQLSLQSDLELSDHTYVGSVRTKLMTTLPLSLRAGLPRFAAWGDQLVARVMANNQNPNAIEGTLLVKVAGDAAFDKNVAQENISFNIPPLSEKTFDVKLNVGKPQVFQFVFSAEAKDKKDVTIDSFEKTVLVKDRYAPEKVATSGSTQGQEKEQIFLPPDIEKDRSTLQVTTKASLAVAMADSLRGLIAYPYACSEQKSASLIALLIAHDFVEQLGEDYFELVAPLTKEEKKQLGSFSEKKDYLVKKAQDLIDDIEGNYLHSGGGVKYWPESRQADLFPSIQVLFAFERAMDKGLQVDSTVFNQILGYVSGALKDKNISLDMKAYGLWATALAFQYNTQMNADLVSNKDTLSTAGLSYLLLTLAQQPGNESNISIVKERLISLAKQEPRHTSWPASAFFAGSNVKNTALATLALMKTDPENPLIERGISFIFNRKKSSSFELTQDPLAVSLAVAELARKNNEFKTDFVAKINLGEQNILSAKFENSNLLKPQEKITSLEKVPDKPVDLTINKEGTGTLYYDLLLTYYLPPKQIPPREEGLIISRSYFEMEDVKEEKPLTNFVAGKNYKSHMVLMVPQDMNYVLVKDLLPAGFEPIDMTLATSSLSAALAASQGDEPSDTQASQYDDEIITTDFGSDYAFVHQEIHDDAIIWSDNYLPAGVYHIRYPVRAITAGTFFLPGAEAFEFYEPEIFGRSKPGVIEIKGND